MAFNRRDTKEVVQDKIIEINAQMQGEMVFSEPVNLKINGRFSGRLETKGTLTIGNSAQVDANITGENIVVAGRVKGNVLAKKMLVLMPTSVLTGDIATPKLNIVEGAVFQGRCQMPEEFLNVDDLAQYLEIEVPAILELVQGGKIPPLKQRGVF